MLFGKRPSLTLLLAALAVPAWAQLPVPGPTVTAPAVPVGGQPAAPQPPAAPAPLTLQQVKDLIADLASPLWRTREAATKKLADAMIAGILTKEQVEEIRKALASADPEVRMRAAEIFSRWARQNAAIKAAIALIRGEWVSSDRVGTSIRFGGVKGRIRNTDPDEVALAQKLLELTSAATRALASGQVNAAKKALEDLKAWLEGLTDGEFGSLGFFPLTRQQAIQKVVDALAKLAEAKGQLEAGSGPEVAPPPRPKVENPGKPATGLSFQLDVPAVIVPGEIDLYSDLDGTDSSLPAPLGFEVVGRTYEAWGSAGLALQGEVEVALEFDPGAEPVLGPVVSDLSQLRILRANGDTYEVLVPSSLDAVGGKVYARYSVTPEALEPFGVFAIVQPASGYTPPADPGTPPGDGDTSPADPEPTEGGDTGVGDAEPTRLP